VVEVKIEKREEEYVCVTVVVKEGDGLREGCGVCTCAERVLKDCCHVWPVCMQPWRSNERGEWRWWRMKRRSVLLDGESGE